jgi:hypothetical protein
MFIYGYTCIFIYGYMCMGLHMYGYRCMYIYVYLCIIYTNMENNEASEDSPSASSSFKVIFWLIHTLFYSHSSFVIYISKHHHNYITYTLFFSDVEQSVHPFLSQCYGGKKCVISQPNVSPIYSRYIYIHGYVHIYIYI